MLRKIDKMHRYVAITLLLVIGPDYNCSAPSPLHLTVDCDCDDDVTAAIDRALPKSVKDGHFIIEKIQPKDTEESPSDGIPTRMQPDDEAPKFGIKLKKLFPLDPPRLPSFGLGNIFGERDEKPKPKLRPYRLRPPRVKTPHFQVPKLKPALERTAKPPTLRSALVVPYPRRIFERDQELSSAEKMEIIKKGVQKMIKFVKVLGQIDQYISDRTRIVIDKLSKTFVEE